MQIAAGPGRAPARGGSGAPRPPPHACSFPPAGRPPPAPAPRGPRRPPQDPPAGPGTPRGRRRPPEVDAHPGAPQSPRRPGGPSAPPTRPRAPGAPRPRCQPQPRLGAHRSRPRKIVFADELPAQALLGPGKPTGAVPGGHIPSPHPAPDYELKYPPVSSERERSRYVAVFQDQYSEFSQLQQEVGAARAKLGQLEALLSSLPPPRSQKEAHVAARVWREFEKKQMDPSFLDKQARCHYLKGKLRHLKRQIQKFDDQGDSEGSVYF